MNKENDGKMAAVMAMLVILALGSGWTWYVQDPLYSQVGQFFLIYVFIPGMLVTFLVCRLPELFRAILIALVVIPAILSAGVILTKNVEYASYAWGYLALLGALILISFSVWNNRQKTENTEYGFRVVSGFVLLIFSFFVGVSFGSVWGVVFFIGVPLAIFLAVRLLKKAGQKIGERFE